MLPENPKLSAYLKLVDEAQQQPFGRDGEGLVFRGVVASVVLAKIQAHDAGLTNAEIEMAVQIGEHYNPMKANPPLDHQDYTLVNTEKYWQEVHAEAEAFWADRYGYEDEDE